LPVQSGSDRVLKLMKRGHTIDSYFKKIDKLKDSARDVALTTDIIVGFPGETDADFEATKRAVEYCGFDSAYIFKYSPRPGTPAFDMTDDVSLGEKKLRFLELEKIQKSRQNARLQRYLGRSIEVLAEKVSSRNDDDITGHSTCHKLVNFHGSRDLIGNLVNVRIREIKANSLFGEVC
jgi:tRNA-2-methylthio-N6-dimethylallyladenosine synthase